MWESILEGMCVGYIVFGVGYIVRLCTLHKSVENSTTELKDST